MRSLDYYLPLALLFFCAGSTYCSVGDRSRDFKSCANRCQSLACSDGNVQLSLSLQFTGWTCLENCRYQCMHQVTAQDVALKKPIRQFFGKVCTRAYCIINYVFSLLHDQWPFVRVLGIQEPASAIFSVLNGLTNVIGYANFRRGAPKAYPFHRILFLQFLVC